MGLIVRETLEYFLYDALGKSFAAKKVKVPEDVSFYINSLLADYIKSSKFKTVSGFSDSEKPLAIMVKEALDAPTISEQIWRLVAIGDHSFFISSFFSGNISRKFNNLDYCIDIGSNSYLQACGLYTHTGRELSRLYHELGMRFTDLVEVASSALELAHVR